MMMMMTMMKVDVWMRLITIRRATKIHTHAANGVACRIWCEEGQETKRKQFKGDTHKIMKFMQKTVTKHYYRPEYFLLDWQPYGVEC